VVLRAECGSLPGTLLLESGPDLRRKVCVGYLCWPWLTDGCCWNVAGCGSACLAAVSKESRPPTDPAAEHRMCAYYVKERSHTAGGD
jgi:hypothetical protein